MNNENKIHKFELMLALFVDILSWDSLHFILTVCSLIISFIVFIEKTKGF